jgi:hypothetical protein
MKFLSICLLMLGGCQSLRPWVQPYERDHLAEPIMNLNLNPVDSSFRAHVYEAREAARGAGGAAGGGCGCN